MACSEFIERILAGLRRYYSEAASELAEKLLKTFKPRSDGEKWQALFAVTGTEAVELALQMARSVTKNIPVLSLTNSYHGSYGTAMAASGGKACRHDLPECGGIYHVQVRYGAKCCRAEHFFNSISPRLAHCSFCCAHVA